MVWVLNEPRGFGSMWPLGDFTETWDAMCEAYFLANTPEERVNEIRGFGEAAYRRAAIRLIRAHGKFTMDRGALLPHEMPPDFRTKKPTEIFPT